MNYPVRVLSITKIKGRTSLSEMDEIIIRKALLDPTTTRDEYLAIPKLAKLLASTGKDPKTVLSNKKNHLLKSSTIEIIGKTPCICGCGTVVTVNLNLRYLRHLPWPADTEEEFQELIFDSLYDKDRYQRYLDEGAICPECQKRVKRGQPAVRIGVREAKQALATAIDKMCEKHGPAKCECGGDLSQPYSVRTIEERPFRDDAIVAYGHLIRGFSYKDRHWGDFVKDKKIEKQAYEQGCPYDSGLYHCAACGEVIKTFQNIPDEFWAYNEDIPYLEIP